MDVTVTAARTVRFEAPTAPSLGARAARGALASVLLSLLHKSAALGAQLILAWLLMPEDLGLAAMAFSVMSFASLVSGSNLRHVLVRTAEPFAEQASHVFWMALAANLAAGLLLVLMSPWFGLLFGQPGVVPLVWLVAAALPLMSLQTIYAAVLYRHLRFQTASAIFCAQGIAQNAAAVVLAWLGMGPFALIAPLLLAPLLSFALFRRCAGPVRLSYPKPSAWAALLGPALWLMLNGLFVSLQTYGAGFMVGMLDEPRVAGWFFWGFMISSQSVILFSSNLQGILFPALSRLQGQAQRHREAVERAGQTMMAVMAPVCLLQCLWAEPMVAWLFADRWLPAVPVVRWLSLGLMTQPLGILAGAVFLAQGSYRKLALTAGLLAGAQLAAAGLGAWRGDQGAVAFDVGLVLFAGNLAVGAVAFAQAGISAARWGRAVVTPLCLSGLSGLVGWWVLRQSTSFHPLASMACVAVACLGCYALLARCFLASVLGDLYARLRARPDSMPVETPGLAPSA